MNKTITSVDNMVDRLLIISDKTRFPDIYDRPQNENETPLTPELFRKLKITAVSVLTNPDMIKAFPDGLVSAQFILINPDKIKDYIVNDINMPFEKVLDKEQNLKKFVTDLLEKSLTKKQIDDKNLIQLVSIYDKTESKLMERLSFTGNQFKNINNYVKNDGDIMSLPGQNEFADKQLASEEAAKLYVQNLDLHSDRKYPKNLLKGEQYTEAIAQEMKTFLTHYENASSASLKEYVCAGFAAKVFPEMQKFRNSTHLKVWEFVGIGAGLEGFTKATAAKSFLKIPFVDSENKIMNSKREIRHELTNEVREAIAKAVNPLTNDMQRSSLIQGITSFSMLIGKNDVFSNIPKQAKDDKAATTKRKTI